MNNKVLMLREIFVCLRGKRVDVIIKQDIKKILLIKNSFAKKCRGPFFIFGQIKPSFIFFLFLRGNLQQELMPGCTEEDITSPSYLLRFSI